MTFRGHLFALSLPGHQWPSDNPSSNHTVDLAPFVKNGCHESCCVSKGIAVPFSPEQADSGGEDIDTRTDVYSLGVVLYQLLAGALPLDLKKLAFEEVLRRLREQDAPRPSSRILTQGGDSAITAQNRGTDPPSLTRQLRGDPMRLC
jgi:serine/threonine protein kinase